jgi:hypothetical protein
MRLARILAPTFAAVVVVSGASGVGSAATPNVAVKACLAKHAEVTISHNKPGPGMVGPVVRATFAGGNQVGLWFYSSQARARLVTVQARPTATAFHTTIGTIGRVFFTWDHKPSLAQARVVAACLKR